jgi:cytochrome P450
MTVRGIGKILSQVISSFPTQWCLIELCKRPELQQALRKELRQAYPTSDPTWDELMQNLPLLDAVVHETLRLHPAVPETTSVVRYTIVFG